MIFSPQSQEVIDSLLRGEKIQSGTVSVGPLDETSLLLLKILSSNYEAISVLSGAEQAKELRSRYQVQAQQAEANSSDALSDSEYEAGEGDTGQSETCRGWRLVELKATSYRGLAPVGTDITFQFNEVSNLIFGPNGSGKSSLLGAVIWALTNKTITDADEEDEETHVYALTVDQKKGRKLREWPTNVTLPDSGIENALPNCSVTLELRSKGDNVSKWLRRIYPQTFEQSDDGEHWVPCTNISALGIKPLDQQLSLIAPMVFGRQTVEKAKESKDILRLMLGFEDLVNFGNLAGNIATNRTRLENVENKKVENKGEEIRDALKGVTDELDKEHPLRETLVQLAADTDLNKERIKNAGQAVNVEIEEKEKHIAEAIGLETEQEEKPDGIGDKLTLAVDKLNSGITENFPSLASIEISVALPPTELGASNERLQKLEQAFDQFLIDVRKKIGERFKWWQQETIPGSRAELKLRAATYYEPNTEECPVCDQSIKDLAIKDELAELRNLPPELLREVKDFFRDLCSELDSIVSSTIRSIEKTLPKQRVEKDWSAIKQKIDPAFDSLVSKFDNPLQGIADKCVFEVIESVQLTPDDAPENFVSFAEELTRNVTKASNAISILKWSKQHLSAVSEQITTLLLCDASVNPRSLLAILLRGKDAADNVASLKHVRKILRSVYNKWKEQNILEKQVQLLQKLKEPLAAIKKLTTYAEHEVDIIFDDIAKNTLEYWNELYPESPSGLVPRYPDLNRRSVEAMLSGSGYCVPAKFFANSGLQRAIALAFYFALLDKHPGGLGFVIMDDSILSLDEEHRETWSTNILKPRMESTQCIFATHQREFMNNCRHDFADGQVVELNPRTKERRISWRPGNRLDRAEEELERAYTNAPNELRKYREELLLTFDAYSPQSFIDPNNLTTSLNNYYGINETHPLAGKAHRKIVPILKDPKVARVLDPGSHALTEADVTKPMIRCCIDELRKCEKTALDQLKKLDFRRRPQRKARQLQSAVVASFPKIPAAAQWGKSLKMKVLGRAAAKNDAVVIDSSDSATSVSLATGSTVLVCSDTLDPIAKRGQCVILADEDTEIQNGDLAAIELPGGRRILRRVWDNEDIWYMQSINPVRIFPVVTAMKAESAIRKVVGVLFEPILASEENTEDMEWGPVNYATQDILRNLHCVTAEGDSLEPIARRGQMVLIGNGVPPNEAAITRGCLAAVETNDENVGNVIKRVFRTDSGYILTSPNPVESHDPIAILASKVERFWPLRGVLFEVVGAD